jgi:hypothetical protein
MTALARSDGELRSAAHAVAVAILPVDLQAQALIDDIGRQVALQRQALLDTAERDARQTRQRAQAKARERLRSAIAGMRSAERVRTQQVLAEIETANRRQASARSQHALSLAWPRLAEAIEARWNDPASRGDWIAAQLAVASARLPAAGWTVRHPDTWSAADAAALRSALQRHGITDAPLLADASLRAGFVIEVGGARLDSTPQALLADRPQVEAALLAALEAQAGQGRAR